jgi:hypothetical protein
MTKRSCSTHNLIVPIRSTRLLSSARIFDDRSTAPIVVFRLVGDWEASFRLPVRELELTVC